MCKAKREFRSRDAIWKGVSQLQNHPLAHECHFAAPYANFAAAKWVAKISLLYKILPLLRKRSPSLKNGMRSSFLCFFFPFDFEMATKWSPSFKMDKKKWSSSFKMATKMLQASKWAVKFSFGCEMFSQPHSYPLWNSLLGYENVFIFFPWAVKTFLFFPFGCKMTSKLWNHLQASKNDLQNEERFAKTLCKAKGSCKNAKRASQPCF